jgi:uncharacterized phiE125 gp8 family phage protein
MALAITSTPATELLTLEEAKRHLRVYSSDLDDEVAALIAAARDDCERETGRTFRTAVTRTWKTDEWFCEAWKPPFPPLLGITSITYFDADNASQTLASSNYHVVLSTDGRGEVVWATDAVLPIVYDRPDAITVTFTTGYASASVVPPVALQAMKVKLTELWGAGTEAEMRAVERSYKSLTGKVDITPYA